MPPAKYEMATCRCCKRKFERVVTVVPKQLSTACFQCRRDCRPYVRGCHVLGTHQ